LTEGHGELRLALGTVKCGETERERERETGEAEGESVVAELPACRRETFVITCEWNLLL
jgi:hypothetical protein